MKALKQGICGLLVIAMLSALTACGSSNTSSAPSQNSSQAESAETSDRLDVQTEAAETITDEPQENQDAASGGKILIAYFAVAENSDVDAVSSASVTEVNGDAKGLVRTIAEDIQAVTGGDLFSIETSVDYPGDINDLIEYASVEQDNDERPELTSHIENLDEYDTIFVGYPLWLAYHKLIQCTQIA